MQLLESCYSRYAIYMGREQHWSKFCGFTAIIAVHEGLKGILCISINFLFSFLSKTTSIFLMPCSGAKATDYFLQNASLEIRPMKVGRG